MTELFSYDEIINFLERHDFSKFRFHDDYAYIYSFSEPSEIVIEAPDKRISDEMAALAVRALRQINKSLESAYKWFERLKDACDEELEPFGICFEHYGYGYETKTSYDMGFIIAFHVREYNLSREFVAKYAAHSFEYGGAFAVEEYCY
ncbi:MAG TPA: hypothetical protein DCG30_08650 [Ruminococcus sp.]|nr:hypothetical protein [Ruminococcus sp.]